MTDRKRSGDAPRSGAGHTVLIVAPDRRSAEKLKRWTRWTLPAAVVRTVTRAERAGNLISSDPPTIVIADTRDHPDLLRDLGAEIGRLTDCEIVAVTDLWAAERIGALIRAGAVEIVEWESLDRDELHRVLHRVIDSLARPMGDRALPSMEYFSLLHFADYLHDLTCIVDAAGKLLFINRALAELIGSDGGGGTALSDFVHGNDLSRLDAELQTAMSERSRTRAVFRVKSAAQGWQTLQANIKGFLWERTPHAILFARNITELHRTQSNLLEFERKYKLFENSVSDVIYRYDPWTNSYLFISPSFYDQTGYSIEELCADPAGVARKITHPDDWDRVAAAVDAHIARGPGAGSIEIEYRVIRKDGRVIWVEDRKDLDWSKDGKHFWINGIVRDITVWKRDRERLERREKEFRDLFNTMLEGFGVFEVITGEDSRPLDFKFLNFNPAFGAITGLDRRQTVGRLASEIHPELIESPIDRDDPRTLLEVCGEVALTGRPVLVPEYYWEPTDRFVSIGVTCPEPGRFAAGIIDITPQKKAEVRLRSLMRSLPDTVVYQTGGGVEYISDNIVSMLGYTAEELTRDRNIFPSLIHPEDRPVLKSSLHRWLRSGAEEPNEMEFRVKTKDGRYIWLLDRMVAAFKTPDGRFSYNGVLIEITNRKAQERLIQRHLNRLKAINELSAELNRLSSLDTIIDTVIRRLCRETAAETGMFFVGDRDDIMLVRAWSEATDVSDYPGRTSPVDELPPIAAAMDALKPILADEQDAAAINDMIGESRRFKSCAVLPLVYLEKLLGVVVLGKSEPNGFQPEEIYLIEPFINLLSASINRAEGVEALERSETFLSSLFEQSPVSTWISDASGTMVRLNAACRKLFGIDDDALVVGRYNLFRDNVLKENGAIESFKRAFKEGVSVQAVIEYSLADVSHVNVPEAPRRLLRYTVFPIKDGEGRVTNLIVQNHDMTTEYELQQQLLHAQKMQSIGTMAGGIAHDFNNYLTGILGYTSMLLMRTDPQHPNHNYLKLIEKSVLQASEVVRQMLTLSRLDIPEPRIIDLRELLSQVTDLLLHSIPATIAVTAELGERPMIVHADPTRLQQVFLNICLNARDAMPQGGRLSIEAHRTALEPEDAQRHTGMAGDYFVVNIRDDGIGIEPDIINRIFDPFFTTKPVGAGTGLGLAVAYGIVERHGGWIDVESEVGVGTTFTVHLPVSEGEVVTGVKAEPTEMVGGRETVLVAEDEPMIRDMAKSILETIGYTVYTAVDGPDAVDKVKRFGDGIDLLLLDLTMPKMTGTDVFREVKSIHPDLKVLLTSGYASGSEIQNLFKLGIDGFIPKPYRAAQLADKLREVIGGEPEARQ